MVADEARLDADPPHIGGIVSSRADRVNRIVSSSSQYIGCPTRNGSSQSGSYTTVGSVRDRSIRMITVDESLSARSLARENQVLLPVR